MSDLTLWLIDHHHAAQQKGEGQSEEGGIRVTVSSQELQEEYKERRQPGWRGMTFKLQEALTLKQERDNSISVQFWRTAHFLRKKIIWKKKILIKNIIPK